MPVAERVEDTEEEVKERKIEAREGEEEPPPGTYFTQYVTETEAAGPCIIRCNNKMWQEILDAGEQPINKDRIFYRDELYADGEFVVEPLPEEAPPEPASDEELAALAEKEKEAEAARKEVEELEAQGEAESERLREEITKTAKEEKDAREAEAAAAKRKG